MSVFRFFLWVFFLWVIRSSVFGMPNDSVQVVNRNQNVFTRGLFMPKGKFEMKVFNNLYTETYPFYGDQFRNSFFTSFMQLTIGTNRNFNYGFDVLYKSNVTSAQAPGSLLEVLSFKKGSNSLPGLQQPVTTYSDHGLSHVGARARAIPFESKRLTFQQAIYVPVGSIANGSWIINSDLFYERIIDNKYMIFGDLGFWYTTGQVPFPYLKVFAGTLLWKRIGPYIMSNLPYEVGSGLKIFILPKVELEFLYSWWLPLNWTVQDRKPQTFNIGLRYTNFRNY